MKNRDLQIGVTSLVVGILGTAGTYYQILGFRPIVAILSFAGYGVATVYLVRIVLDWRAVAKTFGERWRIQSGQLIIGNTVNVALRTKTVQQIFHAFITTGSESQTLLRKAGKTVGESFVEDLIKELTQKGIVVVAEKGFEQRILKSKLELWARYDSSTGIGIFNTDNLEINLNGIEGEISLINSFLANDNPSALPTCLFLEGYLEGVLGRLLNLQLSVREIQCAAVTQHNVCKFRISSLKRIPR